MRFKYHCCNGLVGESMEKDSSKEIKACYPCGHSCFFSQKEHAQECVHLGLLNHNVHYTYHQSNKPSNNYIGSMQWMNPNSELVIDHCNIWCSQRVNYIASYSLISYDLNDIIGMPLSVVLTIVFDDIKLATHCH